MLVPQINKGDEVDRWTKYCNSKCINIGYHKLDCHAASCISCFSSSALPLHWLDPTKSHTRWLAHVVPGKDTDIRVRYCTVPTALLYARDPPQGKRQWRSIRYKLASSVDA